MGEIYALLTALTWASAVLLLRVCGREFSPLPLALFKGVFGLALFVAAVPLAGEDLVQDAGWKDLLVLAASGAAGIGIADAVFLKSLNILGAGRAGIVDCVYSPFVILFSWVLLGETLDWSDGLGAALIVSSIAVLEVGAGPGELPPRDFLRGALLGSAAMALTALGIVLVKPLLGRYPIPWIAGVRGGAGAAVLLILGAAGSSGTELGRPFRPGRSWRFLLPACALGGFVSTLFWIAGAKHTQANVAAILNQTSSVLIVVLAAVFLQEALTLRKGVAAALAFLGSVLILAR